MRVLRASSAWRLCVGLIVSGLVILWNGTIVIEGRRLVTVPVSTDVAGTAQPGEPARLG